VVSVAPFTATVDPLPATLVSLLPEMVIVDDVPTVVELLAPVMVAFAPLPVLVVLPVPPTVSLRLAPAMALPVEPLRTRVALSTIVVVSEVPLSVTDDPEATLVVLWLPETVSVEFAAAVVLSPPDVVQNWDRVFASSGTDDVYETSWRAHSEDGGASSTRLFFGRDELRLTRSLREAVTCCTLWLSAPPRSNY
jgi:hypothetical protein